MAHGPDTIRFLPESERSKYLTLKEAAVLTDYAPDYIGQLISSGKIEGHQVYTSVSWVTTEKAIRAYMETRGKIEEADVRFLARIQRDPSTLMRYLLYGVILCLGVILLLIAYIFFVGIDRAVTNSYIEDFEPRSYDF